MTDDTTLEGGVAGSPAGSEPADGGSTPPPPVENPFGGGGTPGAESGDADPAPGPDLTAEADRMIERWTERQDARGEGPDSEPAQEPASAPAPAPTITEVARRDGLAVQRLETFVWKDHLWQVVAKCEAIPDGEESAQSCVVIRPLAPAVRGRSRAERRRARIRGEKVRG